MAGVSRGWDRFPGRPHVLGADGMPSAGAAGVLPCSLPLRPNGQA